MTMDTPVDKAPRTSAFRTASFDHDTGNAQRVELAKKPEALVGAHLARVLDAIEFRPKGGSGTVTEHVTLSPRHPWDDGKGWIDALNPRSVFSNAPNMSFIPEDGQPEGRIEFWLEGLAPDSTYLFQIMVSTPGNGAFDVTAVSLGGGYAASTIAANGGAQTLFGLFDTIDGGLGMIRVSCPDWIFYEAVISKFD